MSYLKERNKMIGLLVGGLIFTIVVLYGLSITGNGYFIASFSGLFIVLALICYPLAIVYGHSQIVDVFQSIRIGARQPFRAKTTNSPFNPLFTVINFIMALFTVIFFGWIYGAYTAYQKLQMMKSFHIK
ncbi:hypothetical protein DCE79_16795 [Lysinibacillus sp. 2017]|uniref:hypothetical protein n=1 Tax=unclassified Lysinibacillus TaxID=2636778 RepID=UPI000D5294B3|nr:MULTISPECIES: hypothetical protein [unclassified Lysinibacillus]AWE08901.1 hypothetical protein DCE79_16795 [Lysinibacillus sp. 2017]TGN34715.1 hypothetical protein E4L99_13120 [Lysinibacillus sp. S2017]